MPIDYARAQKLFTLYKGRLTRLQRKGDLPGIIALWNGMSDAFDAIDAPLPDDWSRFRRAADDAYFALVRSGKPATEPKY
jgi:hypothetical protein